MTEQRMTEQRMTEQRMTEQRTRDLSTAVWRPRCSVTGRRTAPLRSSGAPLRSTSAALATIAAAFAVVSVIAVITSQRGGALHPDSEGRVAAAVSALALVAAGLVVVSAGIRRRAGWPLVPVGALLMFMAVDEWSTFHERLEAASGVDWQVLYLPVFAVAGVCFLLVARRHRHDRVFARTWLAGAACWVVSQALEMAQWDGDEQRAGYPVMMLSEEVLELTGTLLFLLAGLVLHQHRPVPPETRASSAR